MLQELGAFVATITEGWFQTRMEGLNFSKTKHKVPLSHYRIAQSQIVSKSCFKDSNHIDTVKPGTLLGFTDSKGKAIDIDKKYGK